MRLLRKLFFKFATFAVLVVVIGAAARFARPYIMKSAGVPDAMPSLGGVEAPHFASEESDLMATVFKSALRLFTGSAKREELAGELSDKLYANRGGAATMSELGIELEKPGAKPSDPTAVLKPGGTSSVSPAASTTTAATKKSQPDANSPAKNAETKESSAKDTAPKPARDALFARIMEKAKLNPELTLIPIVLLGMVGFQLFRRQRSPVDDLMMPDFSKLIPSEAEEYTMTHPVHSLSAEDFELLVGLIYQRQGYRVTMPAGLGGGRGGDFMVQRKSERLLVQCKKLKPDDKVHVDRVRELHEAAVACGATRGVYVAPCAFSWDARNFARTKGVTVINAKTLDLLLNEARETPGEDFLAVPQWAPKFMSKVKLTPPLCPACEASMDELSVSYGTVWVCSQRPECRGRRTARKPHKPVPATAAASTTTAKPKAQTSTPPPRPQPPQPVTTRGGRARTICPATA